MRLPTPFFILTGFLGISLSQSSSVPTTFETSTSQSSSPSTVVSSWWPYTPSPYWPWTTSTSQYWVSSGHSSSTSLDSNNIPSSSYTEPSQTSAYTSGTTSSDYTGLSQTSPTTATSESQSSVCSQTYTPSYISYTPTFSPTCTSPTCTSPTESPASTAPSASSASSAPEDIEELICQGNCSSAETFVLARCVIWEMDFGPQDWEYCFTGISSVVDKRGEHTPRPPPRNPPVILREPKPPGRFCRAWHAFVEWFKFKEDPNYHYDPNFPCPMNKDKDYKRGWNLEVSGRKEF